MADEKINIVVEISLDRPGIEADADKFKKLAEQICSRFAVNEASVSIAIVDDDTIEKVNAEFLDSTSGTDVISFDLSDDSDGYKSYELVVNAEEAQRQAKTRGHSTQAELALYITHGLLHNLGFDDSQPDHAQKMHNMEDEILQQAGFGIIYNSGQE